MRLIAKYACAISWSLSKFIRINIYLKSFVQNFYPLLFNYSFINIEYEVLNVTNSFNAQ